MVALGAMPATTRATDKVPALDIEGALKIAQNYLKNAATADARFLAALSLERPTLTGASYWYARWSSPIIGGGKAELGLRIDMDGSLTKVVSGSGVTWGGGGASVPVPGVGSQKYGVRDMH